MKADEVCFAQLYENAQAGYTVYSAWTTHTGEATSIDVECGRVEKKKERDDFSSEFRHCCIVGKLQTPLHCSYEILLLAFCF